MNEEDSLIATSRNCFEIYREVWDLPLAVHLSSVEVRIVLLTLTTSLTHSTVLLTTCLTSQVRIKHYSRKPA